MSKTVRLGGRVLGVLLIILFFTFSVVGSRTAEETRSEIKIGLWFSPWWFRTSTVREEQLGPPGDKSTSRVTTSDSGIVFMSWSWVSLIAGMQLLSLCRKRPTPPAPPAPAAA